MHKVLILSIAFALFCLVGCNNVAGIYRQRESKSNTLVLNKNGTCQLNEDGRTGNGLYTLKGEELILVIEGEELHGRLIDGVVYDPDNEHWDKE